jgi:hypothetical protein
MNTQLSHQVAQQRATDLALAAERTRLARDQDAAAPRRPLAALRRRLRDLHHRHGDVVLPTPGDSCVGERAG